MMLCTGSPQVIFCSLTYKHASTQGNLHTFLRADEPFTIYVADGRTAYLKTKKAAVHILSKPLQL
jgi:hypothetical protein